MAEATRIAAELAGAPDGAPAQVKELLRGADTAARLDRERAANATRRLDRKVIST